MHKLWKFDTRPSLQNGGDQLREYETTFVIDSLIKNEEVENIIDKTEKFITNNGGEILNVERWGKKRLAYELKKRQYGYYVLILYKAPAHLNKLLEREYMLDENILRYLIVVITPQHKKSVLKKKIVKKESEKKPSGSGKKIEAIARVDEKQVPEETPEIGTESELSESVATEEALKEE